MNQRPRDIPTGQKFHLEIADSDKVVYFEYNPRLDFHQDDTTGDQVRTTTLQLIAGGMHVAGHDTFSPGCDLPLISGKTGLAHFRQPKRTNRGP